MEIRRNAYAKLMAWKNSPNRKPLILQGARQVGKTWLIKQFGNSEFESIAYFNFDESAEIKQFFSETKDVQRILRNLALVHGKPILPGKTLVVFDEIQECAEALNTLKYFNENAPEFDIICAGSLLGVALARGGGFPVGKTDFLYLHPVSFSEFLAAADPKLSDYLANISEIAPIPDVFFNPVLEYFKMFFISGGMPEAVIALLEKKDVELTQQVLKNILMAYSLDFSKHAPNKDIPRINHVWQSLPSQLARENKKFLYQLAKTGARAREYEDALLWLQQAGLVHNVKCCTKPALPLSAYEDLTSFKLYALDVGLLRRLSLLEPVAVKEGNRLFTEFKGALSENYVLQSLVPQYESLPYFWTSGNTAEVDFLLQHNNEIIPAEVKSDNSVTGKSLTFYHKQHNPKVRVRFSLKNLKLDDGLLNIPLFMADHTRKLIDTVMY